MTERFAIIGAGNGGLAFACYLASRGGEVVALCDRRADWLQALRQAGTLRAVGPHLEYEMALPKLVAEPADAVREATVILVVTTANAHEEVAVSLAPALQSEQRVLLCPGYLGGALVFHKALRGAGCRTEPEVGELALLPFAARVLEPGVVGIRAIKRWVLCAAFRRQRTAALVEQLANYLPMLQAARDVLEVGLNNVNPVVHVPGTLLNLGLVDAGLLVKMDFYEVLVGRVGKVIEMVDQERLRLGVALGYSLLPLPEFDRKSYEGVERAYSVGEAAKLWPEATNVPPRYLDEDVPMGLVPLVSLGQAVGLRLSASELLIELACRVQGVDYWAAGRTLKRLDVRDVDELRGES